MYGTDLLYQYSKNKTVTKWAPNRGEADSPWTGTRTRADSLVNPVVPCGPRKVVFGRYGKATPNCREYTPDQTPSSAIHTHYRR
jgi:hypothetical protein